MEGRTDIEPDAAVDELLREAVGTATVPVDGRTARAQRTRDAIVDACLALVGENDLRPTGPRVAQRAGVSVRSVFQHFDDLESLYSAVSERSAARVAPLIVPIDPDLPLDDRITALVDQRAVVLEEISPICRAAAVHGPFSVGIQKRVHEGHQGMRAQTLLAFAPELASLASGRRALVEDALDSVTAWPHWNVVRAFQGRTVEQAAKVVDLLLRSILGVDVPD